jgi:hypothetical protein
MGTTILKRTGSLRRAAGYLNIACQSFVKSGSTGFAQHLASRFPEISHIRKERPSVPIDIVPPILPSGSAIRSQPTASQGETASGAASGRDALT